MQIDGRHDNVEALCALVGASLFCSLLVQRSFTQQSELPSEIICWTVLPLLSKYTRWPVTRTVGISDLSDIRPIPFRSLWVIAAGVTVSSAYKSENGIIELLPLLSPLLAIAQTSLKQDGHASKMSSSRLLSPFVWGSTLTALTAVMSSSTSGLWRSMISMLAVIAQLLVYMSFLPNEDDISKKLPPLDDDKRETAAGFRWRVVGLLTLTMGLQKIMYGFDEGQIIRALLLGMLKALSWSFILQTRRRIPWCVAPAIHTFTFLAACDPFTQSSDTRALFNVVASSLALAQVIYLLPLRAKARPVLWLFVLASVTPYLMNLQAIRSSQSSVRRSFNDSRKHPVEVLVNSAKSSFEDLKQRQSTSYTAACADYRRRYSMEPPDGFEDWYNFAALHESPIIDDFDTIYRSVSPFWNMSGAEVRLSMIYAQADPAIELWSCVYSKDDAKTSCHHPRRRFDRHISSTFNRLLKNVTAVLPKAKFLVNHLDEPRVLLPLPSPSSGEVSGEKWFNLTNLSHQSIWDDITKYCISGTFPEKTTSEAPAVFFVKNASLALDLCQNSEYKTLHGLLIKPTSFHLIEGLIPVLSTGALSTMGDILYPSPAYLEDEFQYDEAYDFDWDEKRNNLYWAGSTTGGYASDDRWRQYHRQRFVSLAQNSEQKRHNYLQEKDGVIKGVTSKFLNSRLFDIAFTKVFQCSMKYCRDQKAHLKTKPWADKYKAFQSRLAFDMDGNGISGRYYQLLASRSVPLKQTLLREWHDDRLVPWAHYIPVSQSLEELPELVNYLTISETGQRKAKEIAELGREWHSKAFREVDFSIYIYRLLLELARLQDINRNGRDLERILQSGVKE